MTDLAQTPDIAADALPLGPQSLVWRYFGDNRMFLIGPRPAVLQNMLAELGQGVLDHSVFFDDTAARVKRSLPPIFNTVYGSDTDNPGQQVRDFHARSRATCPDGASLPRARPGDVLLGARDVRRAGALLRRHLRQAAHRAEKEQIYRESKTWYRRYGVSDRPMPADYAAFEKYWDRMLDEIVVAHPPRSTASATSPRGSRAPRASRR